MKHIFTPLQLHRLFDVSLRNTFKIHGNDIFTLIIGANDGIENDTLSGYTIGYGWKTLLVEPLPDHIESLKKTYKTQISLNRAEIAEFGLSDKDGEVEFVYIPNAVIETNNLDPAIKGMSCIYPPKNGFETDPITKQILDKYGVLTSIKVTTIDKLCSQFNIERIDYVQCDTEGYDYKILSKFQFDKYRPKIFKVEISNLPEEELNALFKLFEDNNYSANKFENQDMLAVCNDHIDFLRKNKRWSEIAQCVYKTVYIPQNIDDDIDTNEYIVTELPKKKNVTIVTGLWDIKRDTCSGTFKRSFETYLEKFDELLRIEEPMIIFTEAKLVPYIEARRPSVTTRVFVKEVEELKTWFAFYNRVQEIRNNPEWRKIASWLEESTQANLDMYNPIVMSKLFLLNDAAVYNSFETDYYLWLDAGITNTVHPGYFTHDKVLDKIETLLQKFLYIAFPYSNYEIHGFPESAMRDYANCDKISYVCRGGVFGGNKNFIKQVNEIYYSLLSDSLSKGLMGTEESIFTIIAHKYPELVDRAMIDDDGLIGTFFENLKNNQVKLIGNRRVRPVNELKTNLYVITFNSPKQFRRLCETYSKEPGFFTHSRRYVLDNSTNLNTTAEYVEICKEYNFEHIKKDNLGICGGRQFIAEHFDASDADYCIFLEDDMNLNNSSLGSCANGFQTYIPNLYDKVHKICETHGYDFLKFCFTEFYGDNKTQWAWYNVPGEYRIENFPEKPYLPAQGLDPYAPKTKFKHIYCMEGLPYVDGEIYYCNWPQLVSKEGNRKMFLTDKWDHPFEQTWMSYIYQQTKKGVINSGLLLASPITHHRFDHYDGNARKES